MDFTKENDNNLNINGLQIEPKTIDFITINFKNNIYTIKVTKTDKTETVVPNVYSFKQEDIEDQFYALHHNFIKAKFKQFIVVDKMLINLDNLLNVEYNNNAINLQFKDIILATSATENQYLSFINKYAEHLEKKVEELQNNL